MTQTVPILELQRQRMLLEIEYYTEKEAFRRQKQLVGLQRSLKRGDAWFPLRVGKSYYNSLNQLSVEVFRTADEDIEHSFEFGKPVCFFKSEGAGVRGGEGEGERGHDGAIHYFSFTGTVSYVEGDRMVVVVPDGTRLADLEFSDAQLGVQLFFDETTYKLMFDALERVINARGNRLAYLRDLFYTKVGGNEGAKVRGCATYNLPPMRIPWLNPTQEHAVNEVLRAKDVEVVHGPPGTGKTTTLVEAIVETLHRESQVLVCAQSNMAVDWISERLVDRGVSVLRIGNPTRVNDKMLSFTYERRFEAHPDYPQLWSIRKAIRELKAARKRGSDSWHQKMERLKSRATELEIRINAELFAEARVIACTLTGAANRLLERQKFNTLFIDEAAQALEAACWIAIRKASRVILAGDHCQLPPTVKSIAALKAGLGKTLMERIVENHPRAVTLLEIQYRMNEEIMRFSSDWFYGGRVKSAPQIKYRGILDYDIPMEWIESGEVSVERGELNAERGEVRKDWGEEFVGESFGRINKIEAEQTLSELERYFTKIGKQRILEEQIDVGIISPYRAQVQYLRRLVKKREFFKPFRRLITVNTVDGFQGQERDVIVISLVRSNAEGQIGFLRDLRRMNVAITRARMKLLIIGDSATLTRHPFYRKLWEYVEGLRSC
ncbi:MAG: AAA family ATPase [Prevotella sp.]|nr:AAA family ATPase [Prevotella sp.]